MFSKLFYKFYIRIAAIVLGTCIFLSCILLIMLYRYTNTSKQNELMDAAKRVSAIVTSFYENATLQNQRAFKNTLSFFSDSTDSAILVSDITGSVWATVGMENAPERLPSDIIETTVEKGSYMSSGKLEGTFNNNQFSVMVPFYSSSGEILGVIVMSSAVAPFTGAFRDVMLLFLLSTLIALFFTYIVSYFVVNKMLKPLTAMSVAVKSFANGNFEQRISVNGSSDEINELSISFNHMADSLLALEEMRSSFVSNVSHELKTPMTTIAGFVDGILDGTIPKDKYDYYLGIVSSETRRLSRLVNSILDVARINEGKVKFVMTEFDVCSMISDIVDTMELEFQKKNIIVNLSVPKQCLITLADEDSIYRVVYNITENAIKFTDEGGTVSFSVASDNKKIYIGIKNTGIGIKETDLPFIFDRFYKADKSRSLDTKGVGLGLYMSKQIINSHDENIWVKSSYGQSTEFVFTLPLAEK